MFLILLSITAAVAAIAFYFAAKKLYDFRDGLNFLSWMSILCSIIFFLCSIVGTFAEYSNQLWGHDKIIALEESQKVYKKRLVVLNAKFETYLLGYSEHEQKIFKEIGVHSADDIKVYLTKYPEIKADGTVIRLVYEIKELQDDCYKIEFEIIELNRAMRFRIKNPWIIYWVIPSAEKL